MTNLILATDVPPTLIKSLSHHAVFLLLLQLCVLLLVARFLGELGLHFLVAAGGHRALTRFAAEDAVKLNWAPPEHFWFTNAEGMRIHSMLFRPPNFDPNKKYPLLVLMHGGAHNMWQDAISLRWNYHLLSAPGYVLLATDYRGSTGYGEEFALEILGDPLRGPAKDINDALKALEEQGITIRLAQAVAPVACWTSWSPSRRNSHTSGTIVTFTVTGASNPFVTRTTWSNCVGAAGPGGSS